MTTSDVNAILVQLAEIRGDVKAIRADNVRGEGEHAEFDKRIRVLEEVRWSAKGIAIGFTLAGSGVGAVLTKVFGG